MACPALPTCGLALTDSERILPDVAAQVQNELNALGLDQRIVHLRTTGCPNGCARPYTAEIGIVGESVHLYTIYLGGSPVGNRLATAYRRLIPLTELAATLRPLFEQWKAGALEGECFGDWFHRVRPE
jgi:sulfite reductase (ferredoxin)